MASNRCTSLMTRGATVAAFALLHCTVLTNSAAAQLERETDPGILVAVLQSDGASQMEKTLACKRLGQIGGKESVSALAPLLSDEKLSHPARIALEAISDPSAAEALRTAVPKLKGRLAVGAINSIGARRDAEAVPVLRERLADQDAEVAQAAAAALGKIATEAASQALEQSLQNAPQPVRAAIGKAWLDCAATLLEQKENAKAAAMFDRLRSAEVPKPIRLAATRGAILARGPVGAELLAAQLQANDRDEFDVAQRVCRELPGREVTLTLVGQLPSLALERRALAIAALGDRGDPAAQDAVMKLAKDEDAQVRTAALRALASLGDASAVPLLLEAAGQSDAEIAGAAQDSLAAIHSPEVDKTLAAALETAQGGARRYLLELAGRRHIAAAVPSILKAAEDSTPEIRLAAIRALGRTIGPQQMPVLARRVLAPGSAEETAAVREAIKTACARQSDKEACVQAILPCLSSASVETKVFLFELLGMLGGKAALEAVAAGALDSNEQIQDAATRVLGDWPTANAAPSLRTVAEKSQNAKFRIRSLRGYLRIARQFDMSEQDRLAMCREGFALAQRDEERALALEAAGRGGSQDSLDFVASHLGEPKLSEAASSAAVAVSEKLVAQRPKPVAAAMSQVLRTTKNQDTARRAEELLQQAKAQAEGK